jgi:hypothetical protein
MALGAAAIAALVLFGVRLLFAAGEGSPQRRTKQDELHARRG